MDKSPDAFRTISEVAEALETPAHVLRFWESRFPQIKPVKRAGGRRYYRPADVALLGGIRHLLHDEGMTIRGVQKILREQGVRHVAAMAPNVDMSAFEGPDEDDILMGLAAGDDEAEPETGQILAMDATARKPTLPPEAPAEVVQLRAPVDAPSLPPTATDVPDLSEGFILPTANRRPIATLDPEPLPDDAPEAGHVWVEMEDDPVEDAEGSQVEPLYPLEAVVRGLTDLTQDTAGQEDELVAEAVPNEGALFDFMVEAVSQSLPLADEGPEPALDAPLADLPAVEESPELADAMAANAPLSLAGIAARLRALPRPVSPETALQLMELQMQLGLLHAQMVEAQRPRR